MTVSGLLKKQTSPRTVVLLTVFIDLAGYGVVIPLLPVVIRDLGGGSFLVGVSVSVYSMMQLIGAPLLGEFSDRFGPRSILLVGIGLNALSFVMFGLSEALWILLLSRVISGFSSGSIVVAQAYIAQMTTKTQRAQAFGLLGAAFSTGFLIGPPLGGIIIESFGVGGVGFFVAGTCVLNLLFAAWLLPESTRDTWKTSRRAIFDLSVFDQVRQTPILIRLFLINFLFTFGFGMLMATGSLLWLDRFGLTAAQVGYTFGLIGVVSILTQSQIGRLRRLWGAPILVRVGLAMMTLALFTMPLAPVGGFVPMTLMSIALLSSGVSMLMPTSTAMVSQHVGPDDQGRVLGQFQSVASLARMIGPIIGGLTYEWTYLLPFVLASLLTLCALGLTRDLHD